MLSTPPKIELLTRDHISNKALWKESKSSLPLKKKYGILWGKVIWGGLSLLAEKRVWLKASFKGQNSETDGYGGERSKISCIHDIKELPRLRVGSLQAKVERRRLVHVIYSVAKRPNRQGAGNSSIESSWSLSPNQSTATITLETLAYYAKIAH